MTITERIIEFRDQNGITQAALANALGVTKSTLNYTFINKKDFAAEDILPIAKFLKVSPMWLLTGEEEQPIIKEEIRYVEAPLQEDERALLDLYKGLDLEGRSTVLATAYQHRSRMQSPSYGEKAKAE